MENIRELMKQKGIRLTPQREIIFHLLMDSKAHPTADQIYHEVLKIFPAISFTTVYKTLQVLESSGLLQRFNAGANTYRYDATVHPHPHFICLGCGRVDDINDFTGDLQKYLELAAQSFPHRLLFVNLHFYGYCAHCDDSSQI